MEHLKLAIDCASAVDQDGDRWEIALNIRGTGGKPAVDIVDAWLRDLLSEQGEYAVEVPPGFVQ